MYYLWVMKDFHATGSNLDYFEKITQLLCPPECTKIYCTALETTVT